MSAAAHPTGHPTTNPATHPTPTNPTTHPTTNPTTHPTTNSTGHPTTTPTGHPTTNPTTHPTTNPTGHPTTNPPATPSEKPNSKIIYPTVPEKEDDPNTRINSMIDIFNASLPVDRNSKIDRGLYHEIATALLLVQQHKITRSNQISRPLTPREKAAGKKGDEQFIKVPMGANTFRELDFVYNDVDTHGKEIKPLRPVIVEAKNKANADTSQVARNTELAVNVGGRVVYALAGPKVTQKGALEAAEAALPKTMGQPMQALEVISVPADNFATWYQEGRIGGLGHIASLEAILDSSFNPDTGEEWELEEHRRTPISKAFQGMAAVTIVE